MLENVIAHDDETSIWSICLLPDKVILIVLKSLFIELIIDLFRQSGFVSGGADKTVRFWNFELVDDEENKNKYFFN